MQLNKKEKKKKKKKQKWAKDLNGCFFQRMYPGGQKAHEKMLSITNDWRNANQNDADVSAKITESGYPPKHLQRLNSTQSLGKRNPSTLGVEYWSGLPFPFP